MAGDIDLKKLYERITGAQWFKDVYVGKSLGEVIEFDCPTTITKDKRMNELRPCPYCGGTKIDLGKLEVYCQTCGMGKFYHRAVTSETLIAEWNQRTTGSVGSAETDEDGYLPDPKCTCAGKTIFSKVDDALRACCPVCSPNEEMDKHIWGEVREKLARYWFNAHFSPPELWDNEGWSDSVNEAYDHADHILIIVEEKEEERIDDAFLEGGDQVAEQMEWLLSDPIPQLNDEDQEWQDYKREKWLELDPILRQEMIEFVQTELTEDVKSQIVAEIDLDPVNWANKLHHGWGTCMRNALRSAGFTDDRVPDGNLDDYYLPLVEVAVLKTKPTWWTEECNLNTEGEPDE